MARTTAVPLAAGVALACAAACSLAAPGQADAKRVRAFAVGPRIDMSWLQSRATYRGKLLALVDRRRRGPGTPPVQRGAGDVASRLLGPVDRRRPVATARDLVTMPEDLGLLAAFTGSRGAAARAVDPAAGGLVGAVGALLGAYQPAIEHYARRYPALTRRPLPTRLLALALTDTFGRVALETFAELADRYDVYLAAGAILARDWRIVCADRATYRPPPGGGRCEREDPGRVALLRDPDEPGRDYAYEATSPDAVNFALLYDPDGRLIAREAKAYLTPIEQAEGLDLVPGPVSALRAIDTPVGRLGFVTSKDSWMPDVTARLDQRGAEVLVQPEFFVGETVRARGMWAPDILVSSGHANVLRHPSMRALVLPELTGSLLDFSADAQQHFAVKPRGRRARAGWLAGQPPLPGLGPVQRWVVPDPQRPPSAFPARRARLARAGEALLPLGDGPPCPSPLVAGPCRGGQVEGVLAADLDVGPAERRAPPRGRAPGPFGANRPLSRGSGRQRNVALAARGSHVWAAFEERRGGRDRIVLARSSDRGRTWRRLESPSRAGCAPAGPSARVSGPRRRHEWWPSLAAGPEGRLWLAWQHGGATRPRVCVATSADGGRTFGAPFAVGAPARGGAWRPSVAAGRPGRAVVAWVDERRRSPERGLPQASIMLARLTPRGVRDEQRLDTEPPVELAAELDHAWAPSVAARGRRVLATWIDFREYDWDVVARSSRDGGATFDRDVQVNDTPPADEALDDTPRAALGDRGPLVAYTDWRKRASTARRPHQLYDTLVAVPGRRSRRVDDHGRAMASTFAPAIAPVPGGGALVAWQDAARGVNRVRIARARTGRPGTTPVAVGDLPPPGANQWRPALALAGGRAVVAWEDEREGVPQVYVATAAQERVGGTGRRRALTGVR